MVEWSSVERKIASLLAEAERQDSRSHSLGTGVADERALLSDVHSKAYRVLRAALVVGGAAILISLLSPYLAWFAALVSHR
jgi:hypothetical protein